MLAKKRTRHLNTYVPNALQEGCEILMQSFLGGHDFTSWLHPTTLHHIYSCFNAINQFSRLFGISLPKSQISFHLLYSQVLKLYI